VVTIAIERGATREVERSDSSNATMKRSSASFSLASYQSINQCINLNVLVRSPPLRGSKE